MICRRMREMTWRQWMDKRNIKLNKYDIKIALLFYIIWEFCFQQEMKTIIINIIKLFVENVMINFWYHMEVIHKESLVENIII